MNFFDRYRSQITINITAILATQTIITIASGWLIYKIVGGDQHPVIFFASFSIVYIVTILFAGAYILRDTIEPVRNVWDLIQFIAPNGEQRVAPDVEHARIGRDMLMNLAKHVYQLTSIVDVTQRERSLQSQDIHANFVANSLPLPLIIINHENEIVFVNDAASRYIGFTAAELSGQDLDTAFTLSFSNDQTFERWLTNVRAHKATADKQWEHVRIGLPGQKDSKQFDLAVHYNRSNPQGYETMLVLFDHTDAYSQDDQAMSFVALTVHELRTPLTLLRGYIEVFNDEIGPSLPPDMRDFMVKMDASAQQFTSFVNNILNVAKIDDDQLTLELHKDNWKDIVESVARDLSLRANVRGITIKTNIADKIPPVGVDRYSIYEVLANLIDNAIKYSSTTKEIYISTEVNSAGLVETSIKDFGLGIESNILPHIFDKFYRNHRNRAQVGGTGLGLYLSRAIVQAHGGEISVSSKVNEGSTFTFTILPFDKLSDAGKAGTDGGVIRGAHGWIRNHSLYRD